MLLSIVLVVCLISSIHGEKLHEHMTNDEILSVFNVHHDAVKGLDYQLVKIIHLDPRNVSEGRRVRTRMSQPNLHLKAFDQNYTLYLEENDNVLLGSNTPVFIAKLRPRERSGFSNDTNNIVYSRIKYPLPASFKMYHDVENRAAVTLQHEDDDKFHVNGIVGDDIVIRSLPKRVHDEVLSKYSTRSKRSSIFDDDSFYFDNPFADPNSVFKDTYKTTHHVIIKPNVNDNRPVFGSLNTFLNEIKNNYFNNNEDDSFSGYVPWKNLHKTYNFSGPIYNRHNDSSTSFVSWEGSYKPYNPSGRTYVSHVNLRPMYEPFNWRQDTKAPYTRRPTTGLPFTWWRQPTLPTVTWYQPSIKDPASWIFPTTKKPFTGYTLPTRKPTPGSRLPIHTRFPPRIPTTVPTKKPVTSTTQNRIPVTPAPAGSGTKRSDTVYPQLLITIDYDTFKAHGSDVEEVSKYMAAFWNAVDLRYRELNSPNVRLNIAGLIIPKQPNSTSYMEENKVRANSALSEETLKTIGKYFAKNFKEFPKDMYDIVVGMTLSDLGDVDEAGKFNGGTTGIAYLKGACKLEYGFATGLVRDTGGFNGITTAAHEVAHALGAPHDSKEPADASQGPCSWEEGYLMSYNRKDKKGMHFSNCSVQAMQDYFRTPEAKCLKNKPNTGSSYPKLLPGKILSRDEQCRRTMGNTWTSYVGYESNCATLWCKENDSTTITTHYRPPAEGTYCGEGAICLNAECVKDPELSQ
ncbi:A disintegrin and metalloproteinase with thrombospondin motifs 18-like [Nasonia vitripennis]|uniref:Peptidase M12B domain-containing protein n=1 Tax=Nasonia vitripennis TaxID=7425 RepID=A0A7M7G817_NASVI|nr:A disintegrin and metalloproteinase with thrombospondin motifs 18-like [Nasonia vitripennis]